MVESLLRLEADATKDPDAAIRRRAAWNLLIAVRPVIEQLAGWDDKDWQALEARLRRDKDHWQRLTKKREDQVIGNAIQEELPL